MWFLLGAPICFSILQIVFFGFHFSTLICFVARICMIFRLYGSKVKLGVCVVFELISDFLMLIRPLLTRKPISALEIIVTLLFSIILICTILLDSFLYVYLEEDVKDDSKSN